MSKSTKPPVAMIVLESVAGALGILGLVCMVLLLKLPVTVFSFLHYGWIIGIGIFLFAFSLVIGIIWLVKCPLNFIGITQITAGLCVVFLMIMGLCYSNVPTYELHTASQFGIFANLPPQKNAYNVIITEDIDFGGKVFTNALGGDSADFIVDGNNHIIKNIGFTKTLTEEYTTFWHFSKGSSISNLTFSDINIDVTPDYYSNETHSGFECNLVLFGKIDEVPAFTNTALYVTVTVHTPPEDIRHSPSTFKYVYYNENCDAHIDIKNEGE